MSAPPRLALFGRRFCACAPAAGARGAPFAFALAPVVFALVLALFTRAFAFAFVPDLFAFALALGGGALAFAFLLAPFAFPPALFLFTLAFFGGAYAFGRALSPRFAGLPAGFAG